jgi:glycosyltransferase involved in cell wall biosynthesis
MQMKVLIHALGAHVGGGMRHLSNVLPHLGAADPSTEYVILLRDGFGPMDLPGNVRLEHTSFRNASGWTARLFNDIVQLPKRLRKEGFSAVVSLTNAGPIWSPVPHVLFQRNALYYWPDYASRIRWKERMEVALRRQLAMASMMRSALVVTPSIAMTNMIREVCPAVAERVDIRVLYHGFEPDGFRQPMQDKFARSLNAYSGTKLIYPAMPGMHKGFTELFSALLELQKRNLRFRLFITFDENDWADGVLALKRQTRQLGLADSVEFIGRVPQDQMGGVYRAADLMVYPSLCESFGFALLEAMGHGLPIVAADTAVSREICGQAALYFSPRDPVEGAVAIQHAIQPRISEALREAASARMSSFDWSWKRYGRELASLIKSVA